MTGSAHKAQSYALRLLSYRGRSEREMVERLERKGFSGPVIGQTVLRLKELGYLNDQSFASDLVRQAVEGRRLGRRAVRGLLLRRGVPAEIADHVLSYDLDLELENALYLAGKRKASIGDKTGEARRMYAYLARRGFGPDIIRRVLKDLGLKEDFE